MGLGKQNPEEVANDLGALDWGRVARRGHDGPAASTRMFLRAKLDPYVGIDCRILVGWPHPTST